jgi:hypothetical protein
MPYEQIFGDAPKENNPFRHTVGPSHCGFEQLKLIHWRPPMQGGRSVIFTYNCPQSRS